MSKVVHQTHNCRGSGEVIETQWEQTFLIFACSGLWARTSIDRKLARLQKLRRLSA
jgi:hypothetical protein